MADGAITVFGGSGFLGREIVKRLMAEGAAVRAAVRHPDQARFPPSNGEAGRLSILRADVRDARSVAEAVAGAAGVVNAVSAYVESGGITYASIHEQGAQTVAEQAAAAGVQRLVLISGIGADPSSASRYIAARGRGETLTREAFPAATVLRPSVMFGPEDAFFNALADIVRLSPVFPLIGDGRSRLQPVFVDDVARAVGRVLADGDAPGKIYELGGPAVYTLRQLVDLVGEWAGRRRIVLSIPFPVAKVLAVVSEILPSPPLTRAQVELLEKDNEVGEAMAGFAELGIEPVAVEAVVPSYIASPRR